MAYAQDYKPVMESRLRSPRPGHVVLAVSRGKARFNVRLQREPLLATLDKAWVSQKGFYRPYSQEHTRPFVAGMRLAFDGEHAYVGAILPRSPAATAGLELGDEILAINGELASRLGLREAERLLQGYRAENVRVAMRGPDGTREVALKLTGLTDLVQLVLLQQQ